MRALALAGALFVLADAARGARLNVTCPRSGGCAVSIDGTLWSKTTFTWTRAQGKICSTADGTLRFVSEAPLSGTDALGPFAGAEVTWDCRGTPFVTSARAYGGRDVGGEAVVFGQRWPNGASGTAVGPANPASVRPDNAQESAISCHPAVAPAKSSVLGRQLSFVVWNQMVGGMADGTKYSRWDDNVSAPVPGGTMAGPLVVWGSGHALVVAPVTHAMEMNMVWDQLSNSYGVGPLGSIDAIPAGYEVETMLFLGPSTPAVCAPFSCLGPNAAVRGFGVAARRLKGKDTGFPAGGFDADPTLQYLGYYTDNGAFYYYFTGNYSDFGEVLNEVHATDVVKRGVPFRYAQIDSYWYFKGAHGGVTNWSATPEAFPKGLASLSAETGWKYVAHNRYWSDKTAYARQNGGDFEFAVEPDNHKAIPTTRAFWDWLMRTSKAWGMAVYEQDWLHNEWEGLNATLSSPTLATDWLEQMGAAAAAVGVPIQYCMAYGRHAVASAGIPAVNQIRASDDYATGVKAPDPNNANLYVGTSSMISAALGLAPSKDVFWSSSDEKYDKPLHDKSPPRYPLAREHTPELQAVVALLSGGPVGPGDQIGAANASLLARTCRADGKLLKPGYPAVPLTAVLEHRARGEWQPGRGEANVAYTVAPWGGTYATLLAMDLPETVVITSADLGFGDSAPVLLWDGRVGVATAVSGPNQFELLPCGKGDFRMLHMTSPPKAGEAALLGELGGKIVPFSPVRFGAGRDPGTVTVHGFAGETVTVAFWFDGKVLTAGCAFSAGRTAAAAGVSGGAAFCRVDGAE